MHKHLQMRVLFDAGVLQHDEEEHIGECAVLFATVRLEELQELIVVELT